MLYHLGSAEHRDHFFERMPLARRVDGILTLSMPLTEEHTLALRALDLPLVSVGSHGAGVGLGAHRRGRSGTDRGQPSGAPGAPADRVHRGRSGRPGFRVRLLPHRRRGYEQALQAAGLTVDHESW